MPSTAQASSPQALEDRIFERLSTWQATYPNGDGPRDHQLEADIYNFLYRELRGVATVLPGMGPRAIDAKADYSCRFTSVLNKAFLRILDRYPDRLMRARTRSQLTGYVSEAMKNMMRNQYKRKGVFQRIMKRFKDMSETDKLRANAALARLTSERAEYFEQRTGVDFSDGLDLIDDWDASDDRELKQRAQALRLRYVDGLSYTDIAGELGINKAAVENLLERAKHHLRKLKP